jgi:hypothetical protein
LINSGTATTTPNQWIADGIESINQHCNHCKIATPDESGHHGFMSRLTTLKPRMSLAGFQSQRVGVIADWYKAMVIPFRRLVARAALERTNKAALTTATLQSVRAP